MKNKKTLTVGLILGMIFVMGLINAPSTWAGKDSAAIVKAELETIANLLSLRPEMAIDLSEVSGAYCFNAGLGKGGHMTHYAIDPMKNEEDVIDFVNASSLVQAGTAVQKLPKFSGKLGSMTPNQWYYLAAGEFEPHHDMKFPFPIMIRATNIK